MRRGEGKVSEELVRVEPGTTVRLERPIYDLLVRVAEENTVGPSGGRVAP